MTTMTGSPPSIRDEALERAAAELGPEKTAERLTSLAQVALTNVAIVGVVLTGLGAFADLSKAFGQREIFITVFLTVLSAILALATVVPLAGRVHPAVLSDVEAWYEKHNRIRFWLIAGAFASLILAIGFAAWTAWDTRNDISATLSLNWSESPPPSGEGTPQATPSTGPSLAITAAVELERLQRDDTVATTITGKSSANADTGSMLFVDQSRAGQSGKVTVPSNLNVKTKYPVIELAVTVRRGEKEVPFTRSVTVSPPP